MRPERLLAQVFFAVVCVQRKHSSVYFVKCGDLLVLSIPVSD